MLAERANEFLGRYLDAEVYDPVTVVAEDNFDQVFADIVHVTLDGRENYFPASRRLGLLHVRFEMSDRGLHRLRRLQHFGDDHLVRVEQPPDLVHPLHQRPIDDFECASRGQRFVEVFEETVLGAFENVARKAIVERHRLAILRRHRTFPLAEMSRERRDRILAAPPDQIIGERALLIGNRLIARETFGYFDSSADVILVAGADWKRQRIEDYVLWLDAVFLSEQIVGAHRDLQFALARDCLRLLFVLVDTADDYRGAESLGETNYSLKAIGMLPVFQVDRIYQRLAGRAF